MGRGFPFGGGRHHFRDATSFSIALSSIASRQQLLQPRVLVLQALQPASVRHIQPTELRLSGVERRFRDPVTAANIRRLRPAFLLAQNPDDLLFREPTALHASVFSADGR